VAISVANAAAVDTSAWYVLVNRHSGKAVDVYNFATNNGAPIVQWARNDGNQQQWQFVDAGNGYYKIRSRHSGKFLELPNATDGVQLIQNADNGATRQHFGVVDSAGGHVRFINRHSGKPLDVWRRSTADGGLISQYRDVNGWNQQWQMIRVVSATTPSPNSATTTAPSPSSGGSNGAWPTETGSERLAATRNLGSFFDGGMKRFYGIGDGGQSESQDPMFVVPNGGTIQNVILGAPAGDGIHCLGSCTIRNVWWNDVGEDAATFKGASSSAQYLVDGGGARSASDKVFQHNGAGTLTIRNFQVEAAGKLYRACGNCTTSYQRHVVMNGITARSTKVLAGINSNFGDTARFSNITVYGSTTICEKYQGVPKGDEPTKIGSGADGINCLYSPSDITQR